MINAGIDRAAAATARGDSSRLSAGFVSGLAGTVLSEVVAVFRKQHPDVAVRTREAQIVDALDRLRAGELDVLVLSLPVEEPDLAVGPVLVRERRMLMLPAAHPLADREGVGFEDLADIPMLRIAGRGPGDWPADRRLERTPQGVPIAPGPQFETFQEALALTASGLGALIVGAHTEQHYPRPGVTCVPLEPSTPIEWAPIWRKSHTGQAIRAFMRTAANYAAHKASQEEGTRR
ncbi:LysR family substrate-binding domain-containing protein [Actinospica robiniae]|uniref:LysR family substrate-binding domain-containing protein n=1 Tax=Actinospica robiniae TaxID=304901 RepID=UPI00040F12E8|nr:LysR family substrate-binding domain-containing protein [Actinospica robiniae]